jgi:hypothetical protein
MVLRLKPLVQSVCFNAVLDWVLSVLKFYQKLGRKVVEYGIYSVLRGLKRHKFRTPTATE